MNTLTKSLHTVTATLNVARMLLKLEPAYGQRSLASAALDILGYDIESFPIDDPTVQKIMVGCGKLIRESVASYQDRLYAMQNYR